MHVTSHVAWLLQKKAVQEYLKEMLENTDQKLLIFAHHKDLLDGVEEIMNRCAMPLLYCPVCVGFMPECPSD